MAPRRMPGIDGAFGDTRTESWVLNQQENDSPNESQGSSRAASWRRLSTTPVGGGLLQTALGEGGTGDARRASLSHPGRRGHASGPRDTATDSFVRRGQRHSESPKKTLPVGMGMPAPQNGGHVMQAAINRSRTHGARPLSPKRTLLSNPTLLSRENVHESSDSFAGLGKTTPQCDLEDMQYNVNSLLLSASREEGAPTAGKRRQRGAGTGGGRGGGEGGGALAPAEQRSASGVSTGAPSGSKGATGATGERKGALGGSKGAPGASTPAGKRSASGGSTGAPSGSKGATGERKGSLGGSKGAPSGSKGAPGASTPARKRSASSGSKGAPGGGKGAQVGKGSKGGTDGAKGVLGENDLTGGTRARSAGRAEAGHDAQPALENPRSNLLGARGGSLSGSRAAALKSRNQQNMDKGQQSEFGGLPQKRHRKVDSFASPSMTASTQPATPSARRTTSLMMGVEELQLQRNVRGNNLNGEVVKPSPDTARSMETRSALKSSPSIRAYSQDPAPGQLVHARSVDPRRVSLNVDALALGNASFGNASMRSHRGGRPPPSPTLATPKGGKGAGTGVPRSPSGKSGDGKGEPGGGKGEPPRSPVAGRKGSKGDPPRSPGDGTGEQGLLRSPSPGKMTNGSFRGANPRPLRQGSEGPPSQLLGVPAAGSVRRRANTSAVRDRSSFTPSQLAAISPSFGRSMSESGLGLRQPPSSPTVVRSLRGPQRHRSGSVLTNEGAVSSAASQPRTPGWRRSISRAESVASSGRGDRALVPMLSRVMGSPRQTIIDLHDNVEDGGSMASEVPGGSFPASPLADRIRSEIEQDPMALVEMVSVCDTEMSDSCRAPPPPRSAGPSTVNRQESTRQLRNCLSITALTNIYAAGRTFIASSMRRASVPDDFTNACEWSAAEAVVTAVLALTATAASECLAAMDEGDLSWTALLRDPGPGQPAAPSNSKEDLTPEGTQTPPGSPESPAAVPPIPEVSALEQETCEAHAHAAASLSMPAAVLPMDGGGDLPDGPVALADSDLLLLQGERLPPPEADAEQTQPLATAVAASPLPGVDVGKLDAMMDRIQELFEITTMNSRHILGAAQESSKHTEQLEAASKQLAEMKEELRKREGGVKKEETCDLRGGDVPDATQAVLPKTEEKEEEKDEAKGREEDEEMAKDEEKKEKGEDEDKEEEKKDEAKEKKKKKKEKEKERRKTEALDGNVDATKTPKKGTAKKQKRERKERSAEVSSETSADHRPPRKVKQKASQVAALERRPLNGDKPDFAFAMSPTDALQYTRASRDAMRNPAFDSMMLWKDFMERGPHPQQHSAADLVQYCGALGYSRVEAFCLAALWAHTNKSGAAPMNAWGSASVGAASPVSPDRSRLLDPSLNGNVHVAPSTAANTPVASPLGSGPPPSPGPVMSERSGSVAGTVFHTVSDEVADGFYPLEDGAGYQEVPAGSVLFNQISLEVIKTCHGVALEKTQRFRVVRIVEAKCNEAVTRQFVRRKGDHATKVLYYNTPKMKSFLAAVREGLSGDGVFSTGAVVRDTPPPGRFLCLFLCEAVIGKSQLADLQRPSSRKELLRAAAIRGSQCTSLKSIYPIPYRDGVAQQGCHYCSHAALPRYLIQLEVVQDTRSHPQKFTVSVGDMPYLDGVYAEVEGTRCRGMPVYAKEECRLFTDSRRGWMFGTSEGSPDRDEGIVTSDGMHGGGLPHQMKAWKRSDGTQWVEADVRIVPEDLPEMPSGYTAAGPVLAESPASVPNGMPASPLSQKSAPRQVYSYGNPLSGYGVWEWAFRLKGVTGTVGFGFGGSEFLYTECPSAAHVTLRLLLSKSSATFRLFKLNDTHTPLQIYVPLSAPTQLQFPQVVFLEAGAVTMAEPPRLLTTTTASAVPPRGEEALASAATASTLSRAKLTLPE